MPTERNQVKKGTYGMTLSTWPCLGHTSLRGGMGLFCVFLPSWHGFGGGAAYSSGKAPGGALSPYLGFWEEPSGPDPQDKRDRDPLDIRLCFTDL